jgi:hypothetical protein
MIRRAWDELPAMLRAEIARRCGRVVRVEVVPTGRNSQFAATLHVKGADERVFVKGVMVDHPQARAYRHEADINKFLPATAPRLRWRIESRGWLMLGFDHVDGRHADLSPGSPDLSSIAHRVSALAEESTPVDDVPSIADQWARLSAWRRLRHATPDDLDPWSWANLDTFVTWEQRATELMAGKCLLHTDLQAPNILMDPSPRVVDWAWSRIGAPWVDTGLLVLRLIEAGHTPGEAELWADAIPAWSTTSDATRTAFSVAALGVWEYLQQDHPLPHRERLTDVARQWARHRLP